MSRPGDPPHPGVHSVVVVRAEENQVVETGDAARVPLEEVVSLSPGGWDGAARE